MFCSFLHKTPAISSCYNCHYRQFFADNKILPEFQAGSYYEIINGEIKNIDDEIDFDLPNGWAFSRINSLVYIQTGASFKKEQATSDITQTRILRGGNILQGEYKFFDNDIFIDKQLVSESILLLKNDLITPAVTSIENIGKLALIEKTYSNVTAGGFVFIIRPCFSSSRFAKYLLYALQSSYFNKQLKAITKKSGQAFYNLGKERLIQLILPIPPIKEQERIVNEIEKFIPLINEYNLLEQESTKLDTELYDKLKKSILQYAIQGKLVEQDENDEPASVLLERIRAEKKAKLGKKYVESYIFKGDDNCYYEHINGKDINVSEEISFDLPNCWVWARIANIANVKGGKRIPAGSQLIGENNGHIYIRVTDMKKGSISLDSLKYVPLDIVPLIKNYTISKNDLYLTIAGTIGKVGIIPDELDGMNLTENAVKLCNIKIDKHFLMKTIETAYVQSLFNEKTNKVAQPKLAIERILSCLIPVPPLAEQKRIVDKINEIFAKLQYKAPF